MCKFEQLIKELDMIEIKEKENSIDEVNAYLNERQKDIIRIIPILNNIEDIREAKQYIANKFHNLYNIKLLSVLFQKNKKDKDEYRMLVDHINKKYNDMEGNILLKLDELIFKI